MKIEMKNVRSSNISKVGYDSSRKVLRIQFHKGGIYDYKPISRTTYWEFIEARSLGNYFHKHIKDNPDIKVTKIM